MSLVLEIITPEKIVYKNEIDELVAPTSEGQIAILPNHVNLLTKIIPGEIIVRIGKLQQVLAVTGGFLEVNNNFINILSDYAIKAEEIDSAKALEAQERAEKLMNEKVSEKDFRTAQADMIRAITELKVATKYKRKASRPSEV